MERTQQRLRGHAIRRLRRRGAGIGAAVTAVLCLVSALGPASAGAGQVTRRVPASIAGTWLTDVTAALQQFIQSVPDGATVVFPHDGRFRIDGTLELSERRGLTLEGNGATLYSGTHGGSDRAELRLIDGADWTIRDLTIIGANRSPGVFDVPYQWQHGIDLRGVDGALIENVTVRHVLGDDVYVGLSTHRDGHWSRDVSIINCDGIGSGRMAIAITAGRNVLVRGGFWSNPGLSTFDLEPNGRAGGAVAVVIEGTTVGAGRRGSVLTIAGDGPVSDVALQNNRLTGRALTVLVDQGKLRPHDLRVHGNRSTVTFAGPDGVAMFFHDADGVEISANRQPLCAGSPVALLVTKDSTHVRVSDQEPYLHLAPVSTPSSTTVILLLAALLYVSVLRVAWRARR